MVFEKDGQHWCYVHIPKNCGKYIKRQIKNSYSVKLNVRGENLNKSKRLGYKKFVDRCHVSKNIFANMYGKKLNIKKYITYTRDPYQRIISAFLYKNYGKQWRGEKVQVTELEQSIEFKKFIKNKLIEYDVDKYPESRGNYNEYGVHYMSQQSFIGDFDGNCFISKIENPSNQIILNNCKPKTYNLSLFFDATSIEIVNKKYENDFLKFGYEKI